MSLFNTNPTVVFPRLLQRQQELRTLRSEVSMFGGPSDSVGFHWHFLPEKLEGDHVLVHGGLFPKMSVNKQKMNIRMGVPKTVWK